MNHIDGAQGYVQHRLKASAACALRLRKKIISGEYPLEDVPCFCGASNDVEVGGTDRYNIPARLVVCQECALVRINPRMTKEGYTAFYNNEYRELHVLNSLEMNSSEEEKEILYKRQLNRGQAVITKMIEQGITPPKVVVDWGCHMGGMLMPFKEQFDSETWGIEIDERSAAIARSHGHKVVSSVDELIEKGVKADFIIMQDVIEHFTDLNEVRKLGKIMHPDSYLYIYTPGMFRRNFHAIKQLAHTYYFCANTLNWTMAHLGFYITYLDEECFAFAQYEGDKIRTTRKPTEWVRFVSDEIDGKEYRKMPPFSGICKFTKDLLYANMESNFNKKLPDLYELSGKQSGGVAIIAGGPSINGQIEQIKTLQQQGVKIMAILRMYPWCVDNGITPDYVVSLDCTEDQASGFAKKVSGVTYLFASVTNPSFVEIVDGEKVYIFDSRDDKKIQLLRAAAGYTACTVINGGGSVAICCMSLAFNLGFRDLHIFGLDLMFTNTEKTHADGIAGESVQQRIMPVEINGETIQTTGSFLEFANQALDLVSVAHDEGMLDFVKFYGDSLVNKFWDGKFTDV